MPVAVTGAGVTGAGVTVADEPFELAEELPAWSGLDCLRAGIRPAGRSAATP
jgi:hypothetical protein